MPITLIDFSEQPYAPAGAKHGNGLAQLDNVLPLWSGLYPIRSPTVVAYATMATGPVTGAHGHVWPSGGGTASYVGDALTLFAGTKERLWELSGGAFNDVSRAANYAQTAGDEPCGWRFASFGNHIYATNYVDAIQKRTNNAGLFANAITSTFAPEARFIAPVREFMFVADISTASGGSPDEFAWSDVDDPDWFDPSTVAARPTSVAGRKRIVTRPGQITGLVGGPGATIFKRNSVHAVSFIGGEDIWRVDELVHGVGTSYPGSIVDAPTGIYFWDGRHFRRQVGFSAPEVISGPEIDQLLIDHPHFGERTIVHGLLGTLSAEDGIMRGFYGERSGCIYWTWGNTLYDATGTQSHDRGLVFNPELGAWSGIFDSGLNLACAASLPPTASSILADFSLDRANLFKWVPATPLSSWVRFEDETLAATIRTKRDALALNGATGQAHRVKVKGILPVFTVPDGTTYTTSPTAPSVPDVTVTVTMSNEPHHVTQQDAASTTVSPRSQSRTRSSHADHYGWLPFSIEGRWPDFKVEIPAGSQWIAFSGLYLDFEVLS